jgi:transcription elongation factor Elf1
MALDGLSKFTIGVQCAYCKQSNNVPITLNKENRFPCTSCNQVNGIKMQFFTTQLTTPIESNPIDRMIEVTTKTSDDHNL